MNEMRLNQESLSWPAVSGQVQTSTIQVQNGRSSLQFWSDITYEYHVANHFYTSNRIIFGQAGPATQTYAEVKVKQYTFGQNVAVFYNPQYPQIACLEPGRLIQQTYLGLGLGLFFFVSGIWGLKKVILAT